MGGPVSGLDELEPFPPPSDDHPRSLFADPQCSDLSPNCHSSRPSDGRPQPVFGKPTSMSSPLGRHAKHAHFTSGSSRPFGGGTRGNSAAASSPFAVLQGSGLSFEGFDNLSKTPTTVGAVPSPSETKVGREESNPRPSSSDIKASSISTSAEVPLPNVESKIAFNTKVPDAYGPSTIIPPFKDRCSSSLSGDEQLTPPDDKINEAGLEETGGGNLGTLGTSYENPSVQREGLLGSGSASSPKIPSVASSGCGDKDASPLGQAKEEPRDSSNDLSRSLSKEHYRKDEIEWYRSPPRPKATGSLAAALCLRYMDFAYPELRLLVDHIDLFKHNEPFVGAFGSEKERLFARKIRSTTDDARRADATVEHIKSTSIDDAAVVIGAKIARQKLEYYNQCLSTWVLSKHEWIEHYEKLSANIQACPPTTASEAFTTRKALDDWEERHLEILADDLKAKKAELETFIQDIRKTATFNKPQRRPIAKHWRLLSAFDTI